MSTEVRLKVTSILLCAYFAQSPFYCQNCPFTSIQRPIAVWLKCSSSAINATTCPHHVPMKWQTVTPLAVAALYQRSGRTVISCTLHGFNKLFALVFSQVCRGWSATCQPHLRSHKYSSYDHRECRDALAANASMCQPGIIIGYKQGYAPAWRPYWVCDGPTLGPVLRFEV